MTLRDLEHLRPFDLKQALHTPHGHTHFWERAMSRRQLFGTAAGAVAALAGATALKPLRALADDGAEPRPIPGGLSAGGVGWHVNGPAYNTEGDPSSGLPDQSTIFDFTGDIASTIVRGTGIGRQGGVALPLAFDSDMRFMKGRYIGVDGRMHSGTFGFI